MFQPQSTEVNQLALRTTTDPEHGHHDVLTPAKNYHRSVWFGMTGTLKL